MRFRTLDAGHLHTQSPWSQGWFGAASLLRCLVRMLSPTQSRCWFCQASAVRGWRLPLDDADAHAERITNVDARCLRVARPPSNSIATYLGPKMVGNLPWMEARMLPPRV